MAASARSRSACSPRTGRRRHRPRGAPLLRACPERVPRARSRGSRGNVAPRALRLPIGGLGLLLLRFWRVGGCIGLFPCLPLVPPPCAPPAAAGSTPPLPGFGLLSSVLASLPPLSQVSGPAVAGEHTPHSKAMNAKSLLAVSERLHETLSAAGWRRRSTEALSRRGEFRTQCTSRQEMPRSATR